MRINKKANRPLLIVISPDKGLCGGMVSNLIKEIINFNDKHKPYYITVGKKSELVASKLSSDIIASFPLGTSLPPFDTVYPLTAIIDEYFLQEKVSSVKILTTKFETLFTQTPVIVDLLPLQIPENLDEKNPFSLFEPNVSNILPNLLKQYLEMVMYQNILESYASEQAARAMAMKNATDNANEVIGELELEYNKTRQEKITSELLDITSSSIAL